MNHYMKGGHADITMFKASHKAWEEGRSSSAKGYVVSHLADLI